ncbi:sialate O-acetylesterase [Muricauda sp. ANG21]|uniref:sialate O-acetylesterase n=1 Tax=Allomuricauda sp. ANG21 TaxID=3042468 RepID=UPI0034556196
MLQVKILFFAVVLALSPSIFAQTQLPSFFNDGMVLQRNERVSIWGHDKPGTSIQITGSWGSKAEARSDENGKWSLRLSTPDAGGPYKVIISGSDEIVFKDVLIGEVWLCSGQSNMAMPLKGFHDGASPINGAAETIKNSRNKKIRLFKADLQAGLMPLDDVSGNWTIAKPSTVEDFSALAYHFGTGLNKILDVPIGLIQTAWGGSSVEAWMDGQTLSLYGIKLPTEMPEKHKNVVPSILYNGMLHPYVPYSISGVIWYQGESNVSEPEEYGKLFPALIKSWRNKWGNEHLPFYFVQLAPFGYKKDSSVNSAFLREAQMQTMLNLNDTGMVVTLDIGECNNIHPAEKKLIGERLVSLALANTYGVDNVLYSGPIYDTIVDRSGGKVQLGFKFGQGLGHAGSELRGFKIAGKDRVFYKAQARINSDRTIEVWSERVNEPLAVRYAFDNCTEGNLINGSGLPASSFRTDNWKDE